MLLVHFLLTPTESIEQLNSPYCIFACLKIVKYSLQAEWDRFVLIYLGRHKVNSSSKSFVDKQSLYQWVQVASSSFVHQAIILILNCLSAPRSSLRFLFFLNEYLRGYYDTYVVHKMHAHFQLRLEANSCKARHKVISHVHGKVCSASPWLIMLSSPISFTIETETNINSSAHKSRSLFRLVWYGWKLDLAYWIFIKINYSWSQA